MPPTSKVPACGANSVRSPAPSRGRNRSVCQSDSPLRDKKRRAQPLETITYQPLYHSLPTADREYFETVVANLSSAPYLASLQTPEPTIGSLAGLQLVGPRRFTGPGTWRIARVSTLFWLIGLRKAPLMDGDTIGLGAPVSGQEL